MSDKFIDFREIKQRVSISDVLGHYGIQLRKANQKSLRGMCPLPTHTSEKSRESFGVDTDKNIWACQSTSCAASRQGKKGGNTLDLVALMESCSVRDAALKLDEWFVSAGEQSDVPKTRNSTMSDEKKTDERKLVAEKTVDEVRETGNKPLSFSLRGIDATHPYFEKRGITIDTAKQFGVGFFPGRGTMSGRVVIPISNERGEIVAYAGRTIDESEPKYKFPSGFKKSEVLWNLDRVRALPENPNHHVIVVEGFFDAMKIVQAGFPNVVALMGSALSDAQEKLLDSFNRIAVMLDGDEAGTVASASILSRLSRRHFVRHVAIAGQPDQLTSEEIQVLLSPL